MKRREFLGGVAAASAAMAAGAGPLSALVEAQVRKETDGKPAQTMQLAAPKQPVIICRPTGDNTVQQAWEMLRDGADTLAAVIHVCKGREDDPEDTSVGLGGLPNEEGVVELDACCMHGPTRMAGAVGALHNVQNAVETARAVMQQTAHVFLVGAGAERFALAQGFPQVNLLTDYSRRVWLTWKQTNSDKDWWGPGPSSPNWKPPSPAGPGAELMRKRAAKIYALAADFGIAPELRWDAVEKIMFPPTGTIHVSAVNRKGEMSGATTTSGLAWKIPGRVGDSPILGAGCYTDQDVGSAGAIGSGEENIKVCGAHTIVDNMRKGMSPLDAGMDAMHRIARNHNYDQARLRYFDMIYYILRRDGAYASVALWSHTPSGAERKFVVHDGTQRVETCAPLYQGNSINWPPIPSVPRAQTPSSRIPGK